MPLSAHTRTRLAWSLVLLVLAAWVAWAWAPRPRELPVARIERGPLLVTVLDQGVTRARELYAIAAPVTGTLERIELEPGDPVQAGQVLVRLRPAGSAPLDPRARAQAEAAVEAAAALEVEARARLDAATDQLRRIRTLFEQGLVAEGELTAADAAHRQALAARNAAQARLREARAALAWEHNGENGGLELRAPVAGVLLKRWQESEGPVAAGTPLLELADLADLEVVGDFLSQDAVGIRPGAGATVENWGGEPLPGRVERVEPLGELKVSALGVEEQRVRVRIALDEVPEGLGHGYQVDARVTVLALEEVPRIPLEALVRDADGWRAWQLREGRAWPVPVEVGPSDGSWRQVISGLSADDLVVRFPPGDLEPGQRVRPQEN
ncbi:efflux RND transporter periplasmic adaptor subunit [Arenimonas fontis]|uniref:Efflux RND transporter periplasmic adaptor subunit n=1 Tax=Arenimonas fontis TaxID=2608255 RepID=A0A5B2Z9D8_9GAMM|nr:efflux RND transporter periplasmic adaptor subunit [Arenimonas fontis]KAA2284619.1 efflux RND transporter periplasmic adaptor subunit [Arenimonas fontis]